MICDNKQTAGEITYLQVRYAPADRTKAASAMMAEAILAFFIEYSPPQIKGYVLR